MSEWTPVHHTAFMMLKEAIIQAPILHYPAPARKYIVYMDNAFRTQLLQEHDGTESPIASYPTPVLKHSQIQYPGTGSLQSILCHYQMELLPSRS